MKITTLVENTVNKADLLGEHGLSFLLEDEDEKILFDTGQGYTILHNAQKMGIDLSKINKIVLSHGHFDHTGGLDKVINLVGNVEIYCHPNIFDRKYAKEREKSRYIGIPFNRENLELKGARFDLNKKSVQITKNVRTTGEIEKRTEFETGSDKLCIMQEGVLTKDELKDDLSLIINGQNGISVILGCCHSGIINTLYHVQEMTGNSSINMLIGGIHLFDSKDDKIDKTIKLLKGFRINKLALCHCTGMKAMIELYQTFEDKLVFGNVGIEFEL